MPGIQGVEIYHDGDTDFIPEMKELEKESIDLGSTIYFLKTAIFPGRFARTSYFPLVNHIHQAKTYQKLDSFTVKLCSDLRFHHARGNFENTPS